MPSMCKPADRPRCPAFSRATPVHSHDRPAVRPRLPDPLGRPADRGAQMPRTHIESLPLIETSPPRADANARPVERHQHEARPHTDAKNRPPARGQRREKPHTRNARGTYPSLSWVGRATLPRREGLAARSRLGQGERERERRFSDADASCYGPVSATHRYLSTLSPNECTRKTTPSQKRPGPSPKVPVKTI